MLSTRLFARGLALAACLLPPVSAPQAAPPDIVVGFAVSKSGWMQAYSVPPMVAAKIKIDEINAAGGLLGRKIRTVEADVKTDQIQGTKAAQEVIGKGADLVVVDCDFDVGGPAALKAQAAGKISFFLCAGDPKAGVDGIGKFSFSGGNAAPLGGIALATWAYEKRGFRKAYVLTDDTIAYSKSECAGFKHEWPLLEGAKLVGTDTFQNADPSIAVQINRIKALGEKPDVIALCTFTPGGASAVRQLRAAGIDTPIVSGIAMDGTYWLSAVPDLSNLCVSAFGSIYGDAPEPALASFIDKYKAQAGAPATAYPLTGYALVELWAKAVERAGSTDTKPVVAQLEAMQDEPTILGPRGFNTALHIQSKARYAMICVEKGQPKFQGYWTAGPVEKAVLMKN
ncbi:ABC transporter substrate-binding protein [Methylobacterium organophilum]|uniref:ABC transporter substrate-binding protein n=1 Tax=Methylobacterium organophilum TaxID=410 RepID=UPI001F139911|nr:ABC transporter substrate-binding protein [Methylobacterium organophilum]UMY16342.1 ABC transporter substrate-binding protein [Methylobacterium organophilum]